MSAGRRHANVGTDAWSALTTTATSPTAHPIRPTSCQERAAALYRALERLRERERDAILLRILEGRSTAEVARMLAVKEVSVRSLIHRGLKKLRLMDRLGVET
ncbi:MAG: sigma-70 family RNA polymerase sigma factor [Gammaproteobacteria bacterium]|nr:sigma-70 family RNA polymerase sigma factor [Gammaproteobacteria bacterium]